MDTVCIVAVEHYGIRTVDPRSVPAECNPMLRECLDAVDRLSQLAVDILTGKVKV